MYTWWYVVNRRQRRPLGAGSSEAPARALAEACERAGAAAVVIHGRTKDQRYTRAANW